MKLQTINKILNVAIQLQVATTVKRKKKNEGKSSGFLHIHVAQMSDVLI